MGVLVAHYLVLDSALIPMLRLILDVLVDQGVLGEHLAHEELLRQGESLHIGLGDVHELSLSVTAKVEVAKERVRVYLMRDLERLLLQRLLVSMEPDTNSAIEDEIHLENFLFFIIDDILVFFLREVARFQTEGHIVEELAVLVFLRIEEESEVVEDVIE